VYQHINEIRIATIMINLFCDFEIT